MHTVWNINLCLFDVKGNQSRLRLAVIVDHFDREQSRGEFNMNCFLGFQFADRTRISFPKPMAPTTEGVNRVDKGAL